MTLRDVSSSARRKTYLPAGSVTPGSVIGRLNVKNVRLSEGCAFAIAAIRTAATPSPQARRKVFKLPIIPSSFVRVCCAALLSSPFNKSHGRSIQEGCPHVRTRCEFTARLAISRENNLARRKERKDRREEDRAQRHERFDRSRNPQGDSGSDFATVASTTNHDRQSHTLSRKTRQQERAVDSQTRDVRLRLHAAM